MLSILFSFVTLALAATYQTSSCTEMLRSIEPELHRAARRELPREIRENYEAHGGRSTLVNWVEVSKGEAVAAMVNEYAATRPWRQGADRVSEFVLLKVTKGNVIAPAPRNCESCASQNALILARSILETRGILERVYTGTEVVDFKDGNRVAVLHAPKRGDEATQVPYLVLLREDRVVGVYDKHDPYGQDPRPKRIAWILAEFRKQFPEYQLFDLEIDDVSRTTLVVRAHCLGGPRREVRTLYFDVEFHPGGQLAKMENWFWTDERIPRRNGGPR